MSMQTIFVMSDEASALSELCAGAGAVAARVTAILFGSEAEAAGAAGCGADRLLYCQPSDGAVPEDYAAAVAQEVKKEASALVIVNNTIRGRCLAGKLGVLLDTAVLTSVNALERSGEELVCCRMVYGGMAQRSEVFTKPYGVLTVGGGVFEAAAEPAQAAVAPFEGLPQGGLKRIACTPKKEGGVDLVAAKRIVDVGRGLAQEADLELCRKLAAALGAEVGCSRPVAENNKWLPKSNYMGITGVQVKPELIVALGVSGQIQHIGGINKSRVIVAVNKDKSAPIFKNADFGVVGDLYKVVPALIEKLS
ncbi:electron transfer flavoprotein subunit alpha/FixB family protein [Intestinimonas massiliensis (ex Afouda et al. 2020)]|uniref:electron transfer flavoprotein subunit alpha/FixB family protein n=1 Tax=Intestinimonas massiliensis (ex Afouda et al. 2020) TaxID=1673721 RepID=UPI00067F29AC|nr:electron transfer flavoprotein subunit alpha/FixB family protein [Intestinimonas massiliensis (ex Afouda et al. 2020)]MBS6281764.1 electron transfer flavoprotein subunit alpha/FixB family protein [Oscillospiraceae bacterium]BDE86570.1 electron transfer flavoprotein subunit alpha [Oscillospiraceae bacterium]CUP64162.1 electron transfer flavoprotein subunit alpha [Flavonifractor plautii]SCI70430.1 Electron transfer flavoprotein large subunit [uncultured Flavonifractor sp.]